MSDIRKPRDPVHVAEMAHRRSEQLSRTACFQFGSPPTNPKHAINWLSAKFGQIFQSPSHAPIFVTSRSDLLGLRLKSMHPVYRPHQGARECARRLGA